MEMFMPDRGVAMMSAHHPLSIKAFDHVFKKQHRHPVRGRDPDLDMIPVPQGHRVTMLNGYSLPRLCYKHVGPLLAKNGLRFPTC